MHRTLVLAVLALAACDDPPLTERERFVVNGLAADNYVWARRDPALVAMKLAKMQRSPFLWLRGTAGVFWRDVTEPGRAPAMHYLDAASSRVLLDGDPHPENAGTFRAPDGTLVVDWDDFDAAGYGPFEGDLRRLAAGLAVAAADDSLTDELARRAAAGYAAEMADLASGADPVPTARGENAYLDKQLDKAQAKGDAHETLDELAPITDGARDFAFGDIDPVGADGVVEKRLSPTGLEARAWIADAIAAWDAAHPEAGALKAAARRYGAGVSSYAALRYLALLEGPTAALDDDVIVELKEERDGLVVADVPRYAAAEWDSPGARVVDAQRRMQARADADALLGAAEPSPLSVRIHEETAYQRGIDNEDLAALAAGDDNDRAELTGLAEVLGRMLARAHGQALTADGVRGWTVIAPRLDAAFPDEIAALAAADAAQTVADWTALRGRDVASLVLPRETE